MTIPDPMRGLALRRELDGKFDYVLIDCPPDPGYARIGLYMASYVIVPTDLSAMTLRGTDLFINRLMPQMIRARQDMYIIGIVINRALRKGIPKRTNLVIKDIVDRFRTNNPDIANKLYEPALFNTLIPQNRRIGSIVLKRWRVIPKFFEIHPEIAEIFESLANELEERIKKITLSLSY